MEPESRGSAGRTFLEELSLDLTRYATMLAHYADREAERRRADALAQVTAGQVGAVLAARYARSAVFGLDLASPGWSLLLELFHAHLEKRPVHLARLATDARVAMTTALRWVTALSKAGFVRRESDPGRSGGVRIELTDAGKDAMEDYFIAVLLGWAEGA